jgi:F-type H+-transporting ATPase subunit epsilon
LKVSGPAGDAEYVVTGGFAEIGDGGISVLAERAIAKADMDQATLKSMIDAATDAFAKAQDAKSEGVDDAAKALADVVAIGDALGISVN